MWRTLCLIKVIYLFMRKASTLLRNSVVADLCRTSVTVGGALIEMGSLIAKGIM